MSKSLVSAFNITTKNSLPLNDYDVFKDKEELEKLKDTILQDIFLDNINSDIDTHSVIDNATKKLNLSQEEKDYLYNLIDNEVYGVGPITEILNDKLVRKIYVNSPASVYILTNNGYHEEKSISFINDDHIIKTVKKIANKNNISLDFSNNYIKFTCLDNTKVFLMLPPLSSKVNLVISKEDVTLSNPTELIRLGTMTPYMARFLESCIKAKLNILVCGMRDSGKTTLINSLLSFVPISSRVISIGFNNKVSSIGNTIILKNDKDSLLEDLNADYIVYNNNVQSILNLVNERNGIITSIDTKSNNIDSLITNVLLHDKDITKDIVLESLFNGIDIIINMEHFMDGRIRITSIKEIGDKKINEVFKYSNNTFDFNKQATITYKKIKNLDVNSLDDIYKEE